MSLLPLHLLGSPALRQRSAELPAVDDDVRRLIDDLFETMEAARGVGLAANQVGVARRVAVIDADGTRFAMVNPVIVEAEGRATVEEGCLSIPEVFGDVTRPERVVLEALDRDGKPFRLAAQGLTARSIGTRLGISDRTVSTHIGSLYRRLGVNNRVDAVRELMRRGLAPAPR